MKLLLLICNTIPLTQFIVKGPVHHVMCDHLSFEVN